MAVEFSVQYVRECKGAPLAILVLLSLSAVPQRQEWLERNSGYTDKPVSQALKYLAETGRIVKARQGWVLAEGFTLYLSAPDDEKSRNNSESRNYSDSFLSSINTKSFKDLDLEVNTTNKKSRNYSDFSKPEVWGELERLGVRKNERTMAMVEMEHMSVEYVRSLAARLEDEGKGGARNSGLLIRACEQAAPLGKVIEVEPRRGEAVSSAVRAFLGHDPNQDDDEEEDEE